MEISDVRVKLIEDANDRLKAVCSITLDNEFVVRDVKVVEGTHGLFVAMPSRKLSVHCPQCRHKNHLRAKHCNECGARLPVQRVSTDSNGRLRLHRDVAHPINPSFRETLQTRVIQAFEAELEASKQPGYRPAELEEESSEHVAEPVSEPVEATEELTEYDALIAGLRAGSGPPRAELPTRPPPRPRPAAQPAQRADNRPPEPRQPRPPARPPQEPRRERPAAPAPRPPREPAFADDYPLGPPPQFDDTPQPARLVEAHAQPASPPPKPPAPREPRRTEQRPAAPPPPPAATAGEEDTPFGAGLV